MVADLNFGTCLDSAVAYRTGFDQVTSVVDALLVSGFIINFEKGME